MPKPQIVGIWFSLLFIALAPIGHAQSNNLDGCLTIVPPPWEPITFDADIQTIFDRACVSCHQPGGQGFTQHKLDLRPGFAYRNLIGKISAQNPEWPLVVPFSPDEMPGSLLWWKVSCAPPPVGAEMPPAPLSLTSAEIRALYIWILRGAPPGESGTGHLRTIEVGHSGTWYDPSLPGHGFSIEVLPGEPARLIAFWMTFDLGGAPLWLVGIGEFDTDAASVELALFEVRGGVFDAANFRPVNEPIGSAELTFSSCANAWFNYDIQINQDSATIRRQNTIVLRRLTPSQQCVTADR